MSSNSRYVGLRFLFGWPWIKWSRTMHHWDDVWYVYSTNVCQKNGVDDPLVIIDIGLKSFSKQCWFGRWTHQFWYYYCLIDIYIIEWVFTHVPWNGLSLECTLRWVPVGHVTYKHDCGSLKVSTQFAIILPVHLLYAFSWPQLSCQTSGTIVAHTQFRCEFSHCRVNVSNI